MKAKPIAASLLGTLVIVSAHAQEKTSGFNTKIPEVIMTPDKVETPIGTLDFFDGMPSEATAGRVYDYIDRARGVETFLNGIPATSIEGLRRGTASIGATTSHHVVIFDKLMDSNPLFLTGNTETVYASAFLDLKRDGPTVVAVPPKCGPGTLNDGEYLDGGKNYKVTLPAPIPVARFWSFTVYDNQTRSLLETDQVTAGIDSTLPRMKKYADGSATVYFGPQAPAGQESNWVQTMPGKSWNVCLRLYGPLEPWLNLTWKPGDIELAN